MDRSISAIFAISIGIAIWYWINDRLKSKDKNATIDNLSKDDLLLKLVNLFGNEYLNYVKWSIIILLIPFIASLFEEDALKLPTVSSSFGLF